MRCMFGGRRVCGASVMASKRISSLASSVFLATFARESCSTIAFLPGKSS